MARAIGYGYVLSYGTNGTSWTELGSVVDSVENERTRDASDISINSDEWHVHAPGRKEGGDVSFDIYLDLNEAGYSALEGHFDTGAYIYLKLQHVNGGSKYKVYYGFISGLSDSVAVDDLMITSVTLKTSGSLDGSVAAVGNGSGTGSGA